MDGERQVVLVECYVATPGESDLHATAERAIAACVEMARAGTTVEYIGALFVAADEVAFHLFAAPDIDAVMAASQRAGLRVERVVEAVSVSGELEGAISHPPCQLGP